MELLNSLPATIVSDRRAFEGMLDDAAKRAGIKLSVPVRKAILHALSERDDKAAVCRDRDGQPEPDPELRDTERVPLAEDVDDFFEREVKPHVPDAWIDESRRDHKDKQVGIVGYEINFNRYFYRYSPPRPLADIEADIQGIEEDILRMLRDVTTPTSSQRLAAMGGEYEALAHWQTKRDHTRRGIVEVISDDSERSGT